MELHKEIYEPQASTQLFGFYLLFLIWNGYVKYCFVFLYR